jgi:hypothetical protein
LQLLLQELTNDEAVIVVGIDNVESDTRLYRGNPAITFTPSEGSTKNTPDNPS